MTTVVRLELPGGDPVAATVNNDAVAALGLQMGQPATAVFKAYAVLLA